MTTHRVVLLHNIPTPHLTPVLSCLAAESGIDLTVVFFASTEGDRTWHERSTDVPHVFLPGRQVNLRTASDTMTFHVNPRLHAFLRERPWDVLLNAGWASTANWGGLLECIARRRPHVLWSGSTANEPSLARTVTRPLVAEMVRRSAAHVTYGTASSEYVISLGARPATVFPSFHTIDVATLNAQLVRARMEAPALRRELGLEGRRVILSLGRLVGCKAIDVLIEAVGRLARTEPNVVLLVVGDGQARSDLERLAARVASGGVVFAPGVPQQDVARFYALADVFVLPSETEVWGLVLNEAATAGLPIVVTDRCGGARDLVVDGTSGSIVPARDVEALARGLLRVLADASRMGAASRAIAEQFSPARTAAIMAQAVRAAVERHASAREASGGRRRVPRT